MNVIRFFSNLIKSSDKNLKICEKNADKMLLAFYYHWTQEGPQTSAPIFEIFRCSKIMNGRAVFFILTQSDISWNI